MKLLLFGTYNPDYSRNRVLRTGLQANGVHMLECRVRPGAFQFVRLLGRYLFLFVSQFSFWKSYDAMMVLFPGQEVVLLARCLTRRPIVFDMFTSHYEGYVQDRGTIQEGSLRAHWLHWIDGASARMADLVLTDTTAHADWFSQEFHIPRSQLERVFVGTTLTAAASKHTEKDQFLVHWHGSYIPLQGADVIVRAAALLSDDVRIRMIGGGQTAAHCQELARKLGVRNIEFLPKVPYTQLAESMAEADLCLGIFGKTEKAQRVIPNKVFEALAAHRPILTADTPAIRELLDDASAVLIPAHHSQALADAIVRLKNNEALRNRLAEAGARILQERATPERIGHQVLRSIQNIL